MRPVPLMYAVQSESGHYFGYVMSLEIAKRMDGRKPPPDEREGTVNRTDKHHPLLRGRDYETSLRGV